MKNEFEGTQKIRQALEQGTSNLDPSIAARLLKARRDALDHQKVSCAGMSLAGIGSGMGHALLPRGRVLTAIVALTLGMVATYYWNSFDQSDDIEEIDSALLADDLPIDAYTDHGFQAWLEHSSQSSPQ